MSVEDRLRNVWDRGGYERFRNADPNDYPEVSFDTWKAIRADAFLFVLAMFDDERKAAKHDEHR